jgi:hypothetical protein
VRQAPSLVLDKLMGESAEFYVSVLCDVYRPAAERNKDLPVTDEQRARAQLGFTLLKGFSSIPGFSVDPPEKATLETWVSNVRKHATEKDRSVIADEYIGKLLAHGPADPKDGLWPHVFIRECLESWRAKHIERGMAIERFNMRGGGARDPKAGGAPERELASELRAVSKQLEAWPRTQAMLQELAQMWEETADAGDLRARQDQLRDA